MGKEAGEPQIVMPVDPLEVGATKPAAGLPPEMGDVSAQPVESQPAVDLESLYKQAHGERVLSASFEEALGKTGCTFLQSLPEQQAREVFDETKAVLTGEKPFELVMAPPPPPKKQEPPKEQKRVEPKADGRQEQRVIDRTQVAEERRTPEVPVGNMENGAQVAAGIKPAMEAISVIPSAIIEADEARAQVVFVAPEAPKGHKAQAISVAAIAAGTERFQAPGVSDGMQPAEAIKATSVSEVVGKLEAEAATEVTTPLEFTPSLENGEVRVSAVEEATEAGGRLVAIERSPVVMFTSFTEALTAFSVTESSVSTPIISKGVGWEAPYQPFEAEKSPAAIVASEVAARLTEVTPQQKEVAMPIIQALVGSLKEIKALQNKGSVEKIITAVGDVKQQVIRLFEAIGWVEGQDYDDAKVEAFVQALLAPAFAAQTKLLTAEELQHMGTHEVKLRFSGFYSLFTLPTDDVPVPHALGSFVLFRAHPGLLRRLTEQLAPAYA